MRAIRRRIPIRGVVRDSEPQGRGVFGVAWPIESE
jgi:hypothetical protein